MAGRCGTRVVRNCGGALGRYRTNRGRSGRCGCYPSTVVRRVSTLILTLGLLAILVLWMLLAAQSAGVTGTESLLGLAILVVGGALIFHRHRNLRDPVGAK